MKKLTLFLSLLVLLSVSACKGGKDGKTGKLKEGSTEFVMQKLVQNQVKAETFNSKAKVRYRSEDSNLTVSSSIKIQKDEAIWLNAKVFGIEGGRALIRPDSVFILDRINKQYYAKSFDWLRREYGLPVNYDGLQAMLLGNPVFFTTDLEVSTDSLNYYLTGKNERFDTRYGVSSATFQLLSMVLAEPSRSQSGGMELTDYRKLADGQNFSYIRQIIFDSPDTGATEVDIEFSKIDINQPINIAFNIPSRYTRVD